MTQVFSFLRFPIEFIFPSKELMSKATFVSEIPNEIKGNEVPTLNLVKSMLTSENISDRITEFNKTKVNLRFRINDFTFIFLSGVMIPNYAYFHNLHKFCLLINVYKK